MANRLFGGRVATLSTAEVKLNFHFIADAATDYVEWPDGTVCVNTQSGDPANDPRNAGIKHLVRNGAGDYTLTLQDGYSYLVGLDVFCGDESTTDDKVVGFTLLAESVNTAAGGTVRFQLYDDAGNAQEVTDGNHIFGSVYLLNRSDT